VLLWLCLWRRSAAAAPIQPLAWELTYAAHEALKCKKKKKKKKEKKKRKERKEKKRKKRLLPFLLQATSLISIPKSFFFFFCLFAISWAAPTAYGVSQARG